jgi:hypothetical protein
VLVRRAFYFLFSPSVLFGAVSLTHSYRITLTIMVTDKEIILLDIGSHDEVHR